MANDSTRVAQVTEQDRQRDRAARGIRSRVAATAAGGDRPAPPRRRRPALAALAVVLIIGGAALAGLLALRLDSREPVLVLGQDVPVGTRITTDMLRTTDVASDKLLLIPEDEVDAVLKAYARTSLAKGQLLDYSMLTTTAPFAASTVEVGVPLTAGHVPPGLRPGDEVRIIRIGDGSTPARPLAVGLVRETLSADGNGSFGGGQSAGTATILVPAKASDDVVDAAGSDSLGLSLIRRGVTADDAKLASLGSGS